MFLVTGGAGFIGSSFVRKLVEMGQKVMVVDSLTYAGHLPNIEDLLQSDQCTFSKLSILDYHSLVKLFITSEPQSIVHFAAESHVDNSINGPEIFINTNVIGTFKLLEATRFYYSQLKGKKKEQFRFIHISTDEVFGELGQVGKFSENSSYSPNSPYSATKAASDHLVRAWYKTYGIPTIITNCSNNYGPRQFPEKLIPRMILCALEESPLPIYGKGENIRDWIHVEDHCNGIWLALIKGKVGSSYCFGGNSERRNYEVVSNICNILDELKPRSHNKSYRELINFVTDRSGHDWRYAIDDSLAVQELGFNRKYNCFELGLKETVEWYLHNPKWIKSVLDKGACK